jgi:hypothetical protein
MQLVFDQKGTFEAMYAAQKWCQDNWVSYGSSCVSGPVGLLRGDYCISKWRNMTPKERAELDGTMSGDLRNGPVTVTMRDLTPNARLSGDQQP